MKSLFRGYILYFLDFSARTVFLSRFIWFLLLSFVVRLQSEVHQNEQLLHLHSGKWERTKHEVIRINGVEFCVWICRCCHSCWQCPYPHRFLYKPEASSHACKLLPDKSGTSGYDGWYVRYAHVPLPLNFGMEKGLKRLDAI